MSSVDDWVLWGCSAAVGRFRPWRDSMDQTGTPVAVVTGVRTPNARPVSFGGYVGRPTSAAVQVSLGPVGCDRRCSWTGGGLSAAARVDAARFG